MSTAAALIQDTLGQTWTVHVDSPIGRKTSPLVFGHDAEGRLSGQMADLFGHLLPLSDLELSDDELRWRLEVTRPVKVSLTFHARLAGSQLTGTIKSKFPEMAFSIDAPPRQQA